MQDTPAETRHGGGQRIYPDPREVIIRVKIPVNLRRMLKIYQLKGEDGILFTPDSALTDILTRFFEEHPA